MFFFILAINLNFNFSKVLTLYRHFHSLRNDEEIGQCSDARMFYGFLFNLQAVLKI
jgi:hypothetical protein